MHDSIQDYFPMKAEPRAAQVEALDFIEHAVSEGYKDIVIDAPTGIGKSAVGATCCYWAADWSPQALQRGGIARAGGYYLVTQLNLQRQIMGTVAKEYRVKNFSCLWSSANYKCDSKSLKKCNLGLKPKRAQCDGRKNKTCPYVVERAAFDAAVFSLTNYPFFMTERMYVSQLATRNVMILDECHTVEKQLLRFGEIEMTDTALTEWGIHDIRVPEIDDKIDFAKWLDAAYLPRIKGRLKLYLDQVSVEDEDRDDSLMRGITELSNHVNKIEACISGVLTDPGQWVYWFEQKEKDGNHTYCKPLDASVYGNVLRAGATVRIYMSAFPGYKRTFCKSIGLDPEEVAWKKLESDFPKENRPVIMGLIGSMGRKCQSTTLPPLLRVVDKILDKHHDEKGVVHCHSYKLGKIIFEHIKKTKHAGRVKYPENADARDEAYEAYKASPEPVILISPSMTEGYDFKYDEARWQIIAKVPYPYLGDKQVEAKKDESQEWYDMQTISSIVQATGRICRANDDWGITYILDSDFKLLWNTCRDKFPGWFRDALVW